MIRIKYAATLPAALLLLAACQQKEDNNSFDVSGTFPDIAGKTVYLEEVRFDRSNPLIIDSIVADKKGAFRLSGSRVEENLYLVQLAGANGPLATVINDADNIHLKADPSRPQVPYTVTGSPATASLADYMVQNNSKLSTVIAYLRQQDSLRQKGISDSLLGSVKAGHAAAASDLRQYNTQFVNGSKSPTLTIFALGTYQGYASNPAFGLQPFDREQLLDIVQKAATRFPQHKGLAQVRQSLSGAPQPAAQQPAAAASALLNKPAPALTLPDANGKPVSLASFKGKWVLVDFWASWCGPCRQENPNVVQAYQQFKNKNFTVLGVSLDKEKGPWMKAVQDDGLAWTHISDLQYWNSAAVGLFGFDGIPYNVLVNPEGIIVAEGLRGEALSAKLKEVLQ